MNESEDASESRDGVHRDGIHRDGIHRDGLPPFVKNWPQLYALLIGTLVLLIVLFYLFMNHFQ